MCDGSEYTCANCGLTFVSGWSEDEAIVEKEELWGEISLEDCVVVCDDCFELFSPEKNPSAYRKWKKDHAVER